MRLLRSWEVTRLLRSSVPQTYSVRFSRGSTDPTNLDRQKRWTRHGTARRGGQKPANKIALESCSFFCLLHLFCLDSRTASSSRRQVQSQHLFCLDSRTASSPRRQVESQLSLLPRRLREMHGGQKPAKPMPALGGAKARTIIPARRAHCSI